MQLCRPSQGYYLNSPLARNDLWFIPLEHMTPMNTSDGSIHKTAHRHCSVMAALCLHPAYACPPGVQTTSHSCLVEFSWSPWEGHRLLHAIKLHCLHHPKACHLQLMSHSNVSHLYGHCILLVPCVLQNLPEHRGASCDESGQHMVRYLYGNLGTLCLGKAKQMDAAKHSKQASELLMMASC